MITIYQYNSVVERAVVDPDDKSSHDEGIMRGDTINLTFTSQTYFEFGVGDYAIIDGKTYVINRLPTYDKVGNRSFTYTVVLEGSYHQLSRVQFLNLNSFNHFTEGKFTQRGKPVDFVTLVVANMNRVFPHDNWQIGFVIDGDYKDIDFDSQNCLQVLSTLANDYDTEFLINGNVISLIRTQASSGMTLEYGKGQALYSLSRTNQDNNTNIITRLFAYGSDKNIGDNYRNGAPRLRMAEGLYIERNVDGFGVYEATVVFDGTNGLKEIFPHRIGVVSAVAGINTFSDNTVDFDLNSPDILIPGISAKITFNTGLLSGYTFEISSFNFATKTFVINPNTDSQTITLPTADFKPAVGDEYVLTDIIMPLAFVDDAEVELKAAAEQYIADKAASKVVYNVGCNPLWFKANAVELSLGKTYHLISANPNIDVQIRLMSYSRSLRNKNIYNNLTLADTVVPQLPIVKLLNSI